MRRAWGFLFSAALVLLAAPAAAATGACWSAADDWFESPEQGGGICIDDVPQAVCNQLADGAEAGVVISFDEGETCEDVADELGHGPWDGICVFYIDILDQGVCAWIGVEPDVDGGVTVEEFCGDEEWELEGEWLGDDGACPAATAIRVPAAPAAGLLVLALLVILGGMLFAWRARYVAAH